MNRKKLIGIMSFVMLAAVILVVAVLLPGQKKESCYMPAAGNYRENGEKLTNDNQKVVIDSGHGGSDPGKEGSDGTLEKNINLSIAYKLKEALENSGFQVVMTRIDDDGLYKDSDINKKAADMRARCKIISDNKPAVVVSIHQNSFSSGTVSGAQVFYYKYSAEGKKLAEKIQKSFEVNLNSENKRQIKADNTYYMLVHTDAPTVIAECGFLSNDKERELLKQDEYQDKVAQAIKTGVEDYFNANVGSGD